MAGRASRMYKDSPRMERGESGDMEISRRKKDESDAEGEHMEQDGGNAGTEEALPHHIRHAHERMSLKHRHLHEHAEMHSRHMHEHHMHDHHEKGDKGEMHGRHHAEMSALHKQHENEHKEMMSRHDKDGGEASGGKMIDKVEKDQKE